MHLQLGHVDTYCDIMREVGDCQTLLAVAAHPTTLFESSFPVRYCSTRRPTHFHPSLLTVNGIL